MASRKIGEAFVRVRPDTGLFTREATRPMHGAGSSAGGVFGSAFKKVFVALAAVGIAHELTSFFTKGVRSLARIEQINKQTETVIRSTGATARVSAKHVEDLAGSLEDLTATEAETIQQGANLLLTFCLEESAQALASGRGWVSHSELKAGDHILAYDPEDDTIRWEPVDSVHRFQVAENLIRWKSRQIDVATTRHHRWWTETGDPRLRYRSQFRTTEEISGHQIDVKIGGGQPAAFAGESTYSDDLVELAGWVATEGWFPKWRDQTGAGSRRRLRAGLPERRVCAACLVEPARSLNGLARCDGCARRPRTASAGRRVLSADTARHNSVGLCQSETANPLEVKRIRLLMDRLRAQGHRISETRCVARYNGSTMVQWHFAGDLGATIRAMLPGKKLTVGLVESLTTGQARLLLDVLIAGDGHVDRHGHEQYVQKDPGQLDVVAVLAAMLGRRTSILGRGDAIYFATTNRLSGHQVNAAFEFYQGTVWCPHLRTGVFLARNNGRTFWTGNTNIRNAVGKGNDIFDQSVVAITNMSRALGQDMSSSAIQLGKALNDPIKGVTALQRVGVSFTAAQRKQIAALVESGKTMEAQKIILRELAVEFGGSAEAFATTTQGQVELAKHAFGTLQETLSEAFLPVLGRVASKARELFLRLNEGWPAVKARIQAVVDRVVEVGRGFRAAFETHVMPALREFGAWLKDTGIPAAVAFAARVRDDLVAAVTRLREVFEEHRPQLEAFAARVRQIGESIGAYALPRLRDFAEWVRTKVVPVVVDLGRRLREDGGKALNDIRKAIEENRPQLEALAKAFGVVVGAIVVGAVKIAQIMAEKVLPWLGPLLSAQLRASGVMIGGLIRVIGFLVDTFRYLAGVVSWFVGTQIQGVRTIVAQWQKFSDAFRAIPGQVRAVFAGAASWLYNAGRDLISGLWNGILSMAGWFRDKIGGFITSNIPGPVKKILGLGSPSRLFAQFGRDTIRGFIQGVESQRGALAGAMGGFVPGGLAGGSRSAGGSSRVEELLTRLIEAVERVAPGVGRELTGGVSGARQLARAM